MPISRSQMPRQIDPSFQKIKKKKKKKYKKKK